MSKPFAKKFYLSKSWEKCRMAYIAHRKACDGGMCEECGARIGCIVHHKTELTPLNINNPDISLGFSNLKYVCQECHNTIHHAKKRGSIPGMAGYTFGADGSITILPPVV